MDVDPFSHVTLREYIEALLVERDKALAARFEGIDNNVKLALAAKHTTTETQHNNTGTVIAVVSGVMGFGIAVASFFRHG